LKEQYQNGVRLKLPNESDGRDQYFIEDDIHLKSSLQTIDDQKIVHDGLVLETYLNQVKTMSVGFCELGGNKYSFLALQKNDIAPEDGRSRYLGAFVRVVKGDMSSLLSVVKDDDEKETVMIGSNFYSKYSYFNPAASRISFDCLFGITDKGDELRGITDITGRLGGTCPALVMSALELRDVTKQSCIESEVTLNYSPGEELESEINAVRFIDLPSLRLTAIINKKEYI
jgi:hypothetical protein